MDGLGIFFTVLVIVILILVALYFVGRHLQKKQAESQKIIDQNRQFVSALIIDKKKAKIKDANFPQSVMDQVPKRMLLFKMPLVKIKAGPQIMTLFCDNKVFDALPVKRIVKLEVSGGYILGFSTQKKGEKKIEIQRKLTFREKIYNKLQELQNKNKNKK